MRADANVDQEVDNCVHSLAIKKGGEKKGSRRRKDLLLVLSEPERLF